MRLHVSVFTAILCLPSATLAGGFEENQLGRLFTSGPSRDAIDQRRDQNIVSADGQQSSKSPAVIKVNGIVRRSDGRNTVWVNGRSVLDRTTSNGVKVVSRSSDDTVNLYIDGERVRMKPGDTWSQKQSANR